MLNSWLLEPYGKFSSALLQKRLPGSVLISGSYGQGAYDLAIACAKLYLCQDIKDNKACDSCRSCVMFEASTHPDFMIVRACSADEANDGLDFVNQKDYLTKKNTQGIVRVETLRTMSSWLYDSPVASGRKVCIIQDAHTMSEASANAVLKTFEEPPKNTLIIMVTKSLEMMLPTILSRAFKISINAIQESLALPYLMANGIEESRARLLLSLVDNAPLDAKLLADEHIDELAISIRNSLCRFLATNTSDDEIVSLLCSSDNFYVVLILRSLILQALKYKAGHAQSTLYLLDLTSANILVNLSADNLFRAYDRLKEIDANILPIPSRAPLAQVRAFIAELKGIIR